ncbi:caldesmon-like [Drosophila subobscura]|uniref:caldesmon-like n=1 Tax=Drosophila subobscura TaxID=7241 RepID=UPI00155AC1AB|nr:caldesmon-like [Drosophila subobscura]
MYKLLSRRPFSGKVKKMSSKLSNTQRPPKDPPDEGYEPTCIDHDGIQVPDYVRPAAFRQFSGPEEKLGPGAGKGLEYKNAQYFAYHRFSFVELQNQALELRDERRLSGGIQDAIEADEEEECNEGSVKAMKELESECEKIIAVQAKQLEEAKKQKELCEAQEKKQQEVEEWCKKKAEETKTVKVNALLEMTDEQLKEWCEKSIKAQLVEKKKSWEEDKCAAENIKKCEEEDKKEAEKCKEESKKKEAELQIKCKAEQKKKEEELKLQLKCEAEQKKNEAKCGLGDTKKNEDKKPNTGADGTNNNKK